MSTAQSNNQSASAQSECHANDESKLSDEALRDLASESVATPADREGDNTLSDLQKRLQAAEREALLSRAELENSRKRLQRDAEQQLRFANLPLVRDMLDAIDNLNRATEAARSDSSSSQVLLDGIKLVSQQMSGVLAKYACKPIESLGKPFDPNLHEAISQTPSPNYAAGCVAQEVAVGYTLHERVIRPSQVIVSTGPASDAAADSTR